MKRTRLGHCVLFGMAFVLLIPFLVLAESFSWLRSWADTSHVVAVAVAPDGESYAAGAFLTGSSFVTRLDPRGNTIWTRMLTRDPVPRSGSAVTVHDAAGTPDGVVVVGLARTDSPKVTLIWVQAYDKLGNRKWTREFILGPGNGATGVAVDAGGNIYVSGYVGASAFWGSDAFLLKYDAAGTVLWTRRFGHPFHPDVVHDVAVSPDENILIVGFISIAGPPVERYGFVSAYDANGNELWTQTDAAVFTRIAAAAGTFFVTNARFVRRYSAAGAELWTMNPLATEISGVAVDDGGNPYVAGHLNHALFVEALDLDGVQRWRLDFEAGGAAVLPYIYSIDVNADSEIFVGGRAEFRDEPPAGFMAQIGPDRPVLDVAVDVRPGSAANPINLRSRGVIPVAILTTLDFDATSVVAASICFGDAEDAGERDCTEAHGTGHVEDVDGDGDPDLVLHFETAETGIDPSDAIACLTGETLDRIAITGCESVAVQ